MNAEMVVVFPRGQLTSKDKERMTRHGVLCVEADDPSSVKVLSLLPSATSLASADDLFMAALSALVEGAEGQKFARALHSRLKVREGNPQ